MHSYTIGEQIGRGGMADIYLALQRGVGNFQRLVVFKRIAAWARGDSDYVESFLREARVAASMNHPHTVVTLDVGEDDDGPYLVMEYLSGETLSFVIRMLEKEKETLPTTLACRIAASIASALDYVHHLTLPDGSPWNIVHRDVSPSNVMCCYDGRIKLLDFGVAKMTHEAETRMGVVKGKPSYMAPEQILRRPLDARTDVFQLGILFWEMLAGTRLFREPTAESIDAICRGDIPAPSSVRKMVPPELDELVLWALRPDPADRCPSGRAFADQLQAFSPDLFGTMTARTLKRFMATSFPDRLAARRAVEEHTRTSPAALRHSSEVTASVAPARASWAQPGDELSHSTAGDLAHTTLSRVGPDLRGAAQPVLLATGGAALLTGVMVFLGGVTISAALESPRPAPSVSELQTAAESSGGATSAKTPPPSFVGPPVSAAEELPAEGPVRPRTRPAPGESPAVGAEPKAPQKAREAPVPEPSEEFEVMTDNLNPWDEP
ncbi:MAG: protein kinase [Myxococcota bacterium]